MVSPHYHPQDATPSRYCPGGLSAKREKRKKEETTQDEKDKQYSFTTLVLACVRWVVHFLTREPSPPRAQEYYGRATSFVCLLFFVFPGAPREPFPVRIRSDLLTLGQRDAEASK